MAILVLWGAITECEPVFSERRQLEPAVYTADQKYFRCLGEGVRTALERTIDVHGYSGEVTICIHERRYVRCDGQYHHEDKYQSLHILITIGCWG